jgi:FkbM family methyltransferase
VSRLRALLRTRRARRDERPIGERLAGPKLIAAFAAAHPDAVFVEIGSNDGEQHDFLRPHVLASNWTGVMVEPVPYVFERLRRNYGGIERVALENVAIADRDGTLPFFYLRDADEAERSSLPDWYDGVGSFNREAILSHAPQMPDIAARIVEHNVPTLRFASLCERHGLDRVDLIAIDTEGHDWEIIRTIDLSAHFPRLIVYEHFHLSPGDRVACRAHVERQGYETMEEGFDTFCLRAGGPDDALGRAWRTLEPAVAGVAKYDERA